MTVPSHQMMTTSFHREGNGPRSRRLLFSWTGWATSDEEALARARRAMDLAFAALMAARGCPDPGRPADLDAAITTVSRADAHPAAAIGTEWSIGTRMVSIADGLAASHTREEADAAAVSTITEVARGLSDPGQGCETWCDDDTFGNGIAVSTHDDDEVADDARPAKNALDDIRMALCLRIREGLDPKNEREIQQISHDPEASATLSAARTAQARRQMEKVPSLLAKLGLVELKREFDTIHGVTA